MQRIDGHPHVYRRANGALYYVRRVPTDLSGVIVEQQFKRSLRHRDQRLPASKCAYDAVHREVETLIAKARSGHALPDAQRRYQEAVMRAQRLGFDYRPMDGLAGAASARKSGWPALSRWKARSATGRRRMHTPFLAR